MKYIDLQNISQFITDLRFFYFVYIFYNISNKEIED